MTYKSHADVPPVPDSRATEIMLELLDLKPSDVLMEIGTGTGTQTAEWQKHCAEVHSVELERNYKVNDQLLGPHVYLSYGDGAKGIPGMSFDAIIATCGINEIPDAWVDQLKDGGRLVAPIGRIDCQKLSLWRKIGVEMFPLRVAAYVRFVMMES